MRNRTIFTALVAVVFTLLINSSALAAPVPPYSTYGTVKVNGANIDAGTEITAWIDGVKYGETDSIMFNGNSMYNIIVSSDDSDTAGVIEGGVLGDTVVFKVDGVDANETGSWSSGGGGELNLTVDNSSGGGAIQAGFTCNPLSGSAPLTVNCIDSSTGDIVGWLWDFGDGTTSTAKSPPAHVYSANSIYTIQLTVTDASGQTDSRTLNVSISGTSAGTVKINLVSSGELTRDWTDVIFPETNLAGQDELAYANPTTWIARDTTGLGEGWHLTLQAADHFRGSSDPVNRVIEVGASQGFKVQCSDNEITPITDLSYAGDLPTCAVGVQPIPNGALGESAVTLLSADVNDARGAYNFVPKFQLLVPGSTIIDEYVTTIYVDIISGP